MSVSVWAVGPTKSFITILFTTHSLATWQASTELSGSGHPDSGSLASNPRFSNISGNMSQLADFYLASILLASALDESEQTWVRISTKLDHDINYRVKKWL